jgi:hypothetical protein
LLAALVDHLWQSVLIFPVLALGAVLARRNAAIVRLWIWRIAALKFVVPFYLLFVIGGWLGFPVKNAEDAVPDYIAAPMAALSPWFVPAQAHGIGGLALAGCIALLLVAAITCARLSHDNQCLERLSMTGEMLRAARDPDDTPPGLGFVRGFLFAAATMIALASPLLAGAVDDRQNRHALLLADARTLRDATIEMTPAAPGMGQRSRITAHSNGVFIRNATIQDLAAFAYGVNRFFVRGDHFYEAGEQDWLIDARYDMRIDGEVHDPDRFDTYALRVPVTRMLAQEHGLEIYVNSACQPPCGRYGVPIPPDAP